MPTDPKLPTAKDSDSIVPSLEMIIVVYVVLVLFAWYLIYMYAPFTVQRLFHFLFDPLIS
jgi:hypothetical protein